MHAPLISMLKILSDPIINQTINCSSVQINRSQSLQLWFRIFFNYFTNKIIPNNQMLTFSARPYPHPITIWIQAFPHSSSSSAANHRNVLQHCTREDVIHLLWFARIQWERTKMHFNDVLHVYAKIVNVSLDRHSSYV